MSEEKGEKAEKGKEHTMPNMHGITMRDTSVRVLTFVAILAVLGFAGAIVFSGMPEEATQTKTLTILHAWEEGGQYYFADELGCVYHIGCEKDFWAHPQEELRYDDMPKVRFDKLEEGQRYHIEYVIRQGNVRLSLGEGEMVR